MPIVVLVALSTPRTLQKAATAQAPQTGLTDEQSRPARTKIELVRSLPRYRQQTILAPGDAAAPTEQEAER